MTYNHSVVMLLIRWWLLSKVFQLMAYIFTRLVAFLLSWLPTWFRWIPTSVEELERAESKVLGYLKRPYRTRFHEIENIKGIKGNNKVWTLSMNDEADESQHVPLVLLHGFASGVGLWVLNLDSISSNRKVYALDLLGFGRSSRPTFSNNAWEAEYQLVQSVEEWRKAANIKKFVLLGHSMGGFLAASYSLRYPERVSHLILADPWGFPEPPLNPNKHYQLPMWVKAVVAVMQPFNPLAGLRAAGPWGPRLVEKFRPDLRKKFDHFVKDVEAVPNYIFHCNAQFPSGEAAFKSMMTQIGWAKHPMIGRISELHPDIPITFIYGSRSWIDRQPGLQVKHSRPESFVEVQIIEAAGHHVYADKSDQFNSIVQNVCDWVDSIEKKKSSKEESSYRTAVSSNSSMISGTDGYSFPDLDIKTDDPW